MRKPFWSSKRNKFLLFAAIAFVCQSCSLDQDKSIALEDIDFDTRDDTELFFKNIRQSSYHLEENKPASINIFRLKDNPLDSNSLEPNPIIIHHWLRDKAYLWLEIGGVSNFDEPLEFTVAYPESEEVLKFDGASPKNHTEVALALFNACLSEATITCNGNKILAPNTSSKTNYQLIMNDYFRLLGLK